MLRNYIYMRSKSTKNSTKKIAHKNAAPNERARLGLALILDLVLFGIPIFELRVFRLKTAAQTTEVVDSECSEQVNCGWSAEPDA